MIVFNVYNIYVKLTILASNPHIHLVKRNIFFFINVNWFSQSKISFKNMGIQSKKYGWHKNTHQTFKLHCHWPELLAPTYLQSFQWHKNLIDILKKHLINCHLFGKLIKKKKIYSIMIITFIFIIIFNDELVFFFFMSITL